MNFLANEFWEMSFGNELDISTKKNRNMNANSIPDEYINDFVALEA